jgi:hypothetical protein
MRSTRTPFRTLEQRCYATRGRLRLASLIVVVALAGASALVVSGEALAQNTARPASSTAQVAEPGSGWTVVSSANLSFQDGLSAAACPAVDDYWAVGGADTGAVEQTLIEQNTGDGWGVLSSPDTSPTVPNTLNAVACASTTDCWAVGEDYLGTLIEHYAGTGWSIVSSPDPSGSADYLLGVGCGSASSCFAVGYYLDASDVTQTLIEQYTDTGWALVTSPDENTVGANHLDSIACVSPSDCWAVGWDYQPYSGGAVQTLTEQYSSGSWSIVPSGNYGSPDYDANYLYGVTCVSSDDCWAVGVIYTGGFFALVLHYNGTSWTVDPSAGGIGGALEAVACVSSDDCWAVGWGAPPLLRQYSGNTWSAVSNPSAGSGWSELLGVTCDGSMNCWAVGDSSAFETLIEQSVQGDAPPMVTSLTPAAGPVGGGQTVTVDGYGFVAGMTVTLGGVSVTPADVTPDSFTFTTPAESAGYVTLQATDGYGSSLADGNAGYIYASLSAYHPLTPFRILDTRSGSCIQCGSGALLPSGTMTLQVTGYTDPSSGESVPSSATAVALNVTAVSGSAGSFIGVYPAGTGRPDSSNLNFDAQTNTANLVVVALGPTGAVDLYNSLGAVDVVADVEGYFTAPAGTQGQFHPIAPLRVCDTRLGQPANPCNDQGTQDLTLGPGQVAKVDVAAVTSAQGDIPSDGSAEAAVLNLTAVSGTQATYLSVFPSSSNGTCSTAVPQSSTLNVSARTNQANRVSVPLGPAASGGPDTDVCVYNSLGSIDFILDANGWFGSSTAAAGSDFQVIGPSRICDTRAGMGTECSGDSLTPGGVLPVQVTGVGGVPGSGPVAVVANLTAVSGTSMTYFTLYPAGGTTPNASDLNVDAQQNLPNLAITELSSGGALDLYNSLGTIDAILDVEGWFQAPPPYSALSHGNVDGVVWPGSRRQS